MSDKSRRKLIKSIAAGSGAVIASKSLPEKWTKPAIDSVLLPAHAQTSTGLFCESTAAPFGDHVPPGPDVDMSGGSVPVPWRVAVVPPPTAPNDEVFIQLFIDGVLAQALTITLAADGTYATTGQLGSLDAGSVIEFRFTWQPYDQCSLFWNLLPLPPGIQSDGTGSSLN